MKKLFLLLTVLLMFSCDVNAPKEYIRASKVIPNSLRAEAAAFVIELVKVGNPMSDEESEDAMAEAWNIAKDLYGVEEYGMWVSHTFVPYDKLSSMQRVAVNIWLGKSR